jgi:hypothetical protein
MSRLSNCRVIEIRPHKNGWRCFEGPGVEPFWRGATAKDDALHYAKERAKTEGATIRIMKEAGEVAETLRFKDGEFRALGL